jgi:hypothetical protein
MRFVFFILLIITSLVSSAQEFIEICAGETKTMTYFVTSSIDGDITWNVNGVNYITDELTYDFSEDGVYNFKVRLDNGPCYIEQELMVVVTECSGIIYWVPNTFTPDGNESNQQFGPVMSSGYDISGFSFIIFNRWGEVMWETYDPNIFWGGRYNNILCQDGIYTWKLEFSVFGNDGKIRDYGFVTLIK